MKQKNFQIDGSSLDFDLIIQDAQTGQEFKDDSRYIQKNTSVVVRRIPVTAAVARKIHQPCETNIISSTEGHQTKVFLFLFCSHLKS